MNTTAWYQGLIDDNGLAELRVEKNGEWLSKHHRDTHSLMLDVQQHDDEGFNCYTTINRPKPEEFEDSKPRFLRDADIDVVSRLLIDFDPKRKSSPSTPRQLDHARAAARKVEALLASLGWPEPARAESGNGIHLLYRVRIPNVVEWHPKWQSCLKGLKQIFNFEKVEIDTSVANPAQLTRAYGSVNRKATKPSAESRCRRSEVFVPANYQCVPWTALQGLVDLAGETLGTQVGHAPAKAHRPARSDRRGLGKGDYKTLDVITWFRMLDRYKFQCDAHKHAVICPWADQHTGGGKADASTCTVFFTNNTYPVFHCSHNSCTDRDLFDVIEALPDADQFCSQTWGVQR